MGCCSLGFEMNPYNSFFFLDNAMYCKPTVRNDRCLAAIALFEEDFYPVHAADFFVACEDETNIMFGVRKLFHECHHDGVAAFHVERAATVEAFAITTRYELFIVSIDDIEVAAEEDFWSFGVFGDGERGDAAVMVGFDVERGVIEIVGGEVAGEEDLFGVCMGRADTDKMFGEVDKVTERVHMYCF